MSFQQAAGGDQRDPAPCLSYGHPPGLMVLPGIFRGLQDEAAGRYPYLEYIRIGVASMFTELTRIPMRFNNIVTKDYEGA